MEAIRQFVAFAAGQCVARGDLFAVADAVKTAHDAGQWPNVLVFDAASSEQIDLVLDGNAAQTRQFAQIWLDGQSRKVEEVVVEAVPRGRGRPKLGVVAREITLLPRHWDWLGSQPSGTSAVLRKLIEREMRATSQEREAGQSRDACYRFLLAVAGNQPGYEQAIRMLYAADAAAFAAQIAPMGKDIAAHAGALAGRWFEYAANNAQGRNHEP